MLSYQHAYHAGGPADVIKHILWAQLVAHLAASPKPLNVFETHAGRGTYPVNTPEIRKLAEYRHGLGRLLAELPTHPAIPATAYLRMVHQTMQGAALTSIPGSPAIAAALATPNTTLHLCEAHPGEMQHLREALRAQTHTHFHAADGHKQIPALIRPGQRNLVLIDPSYEVKTEYAQTVQTVDAIVRKAPQTTVMVWYPLLPGNRHQPLVDGLKALGVQATQLVHYSWNPQGAPGMHGTGQIILNTPYRVEETWQPVLREIAPVLAQGANQLTQAWLVPRR